MRTTDGPAGAPNPKEQLRAHSRHPWRAILRFLAVVLPAVVACGLGGCERPGEPSGANGQPSLVGLLPEGAPRPNIIMILVDALRADRLGVYGHPGGLSPTIDAVAAEGVTFDHCVAAAPWTAPSVASLFVSYYPSVHKTTKYRVVPGRGQRRQMAYQSVLSNEFTTLAEVLRANGYQTAGFSANTVVRERHGYAQGFEHFNSRFAANTVRGELVNQAAFEWLAEARDPNRPLFLYLHYMDVHGPYNAAPRFMDPLVEQVEANPKKQELTQTQWNALRGYLRHPPPEASDPQRYQRLNRRREYWVARYEAGVAEGDFYLGQLVQGLKERGIWDNAYVVFLADHGEALCEHERWDHGNTQYQNELHVPLILRWPSVLPAGKRIRRLASLIDVLPTLLEQLRLPLEENYQGVSLVDHLSDRLPAPPLVRFAEAEKANSQYAFFCEPMKLLVFRSPEEELSAGTTRPADIPARVFDLARDPGETIDLTPQQPELAGELLRLARETIQANCNTKPGIVEEQAPVDQETMERLRGLGYVGGQEDEGAKGP